MENKIYTTMEHLKTFELFDGGFNPIVPLSSITSYVKCNDCEALYKERYKPKMCRYCQSGDLKILDVDEWYDEASKRLEPDEVADLMDSREKEDQTFVDLVTHREREKPN